MFENYIDVIEASKILNVHPETVKRLIREGKLTATKVREQMDHGEGTVSGCLLAPMTEAAGE